MIQKLFLAFLVTISVGTSASAMAIPMWRPGGEFYQTEDNTKVLLIQRKNTQSLVLGPSWTASTKDFGLLIPVPAKPTLTEASESIFDELETLTNQNRYWIYPMMKSVEAAPQYVGGGVTVVEKKDIGKMSATILQASDAAGLSVWLTQNGYAVGAYSKENIDYYVQKKGYYFVALKVNVESVTAANAEGGYLGKLNPVQISFSSSKPYLPVRSMYSDSKLVNFTIFTLTDKPYYIDGSELQFARPLTTNDMQVAPSLKKQARLGDWMTRSLVSFDPKEIKEDLVLTEGSRAIKIASIQERRLINPDKTNTLAGVATESLAQPLFASSKTSRLGFTRALTTGSRGADVKILQYILMSKGYIASEGVTGIFDADTKAGLVLLQEEKADTILKSLKMTEGNGIFGATTRKVLNKEYF